MSESDALEMKARELFEIARPCFHYAKRGTPDGAGFERSETGRLLMNAMRKIAALSPPPPAVGGEVERVSRENADLRKIMDAMQARHQSQIEAFELLMTPTLTPQGGQ